MLCLNLSVSILSEELSFELFYVVILLLYHLEFTLQASFVHIGLRESPFKFKTKSCISCTRNCYTHQH